MLKVVPRRSHDVCLVGTRVSVVLSEVEFAFFSAAAFSTGSVEAGLPFVS